MKIAIKLLALLFLIQAPYTFAARKIVLDARIEEAVAEFYDKSMAGKKLAQKAKGMLVFPTVGKPVSELAANMAKGH